MSTISFVGLLVAALVILSASVAEAAAASVRGILTACAGQAVALVQENVLASACHRMELETSISRQHWAAEG